MLDSWSRYQRKLYYKRSVPGNLVALLARQSFYRGGHMHRFYCISACVLIDLTATIALHLSIERVPLHVQLIFRCHIYQVSISFIVCQRLNSKHMYSTPTTEGCSSTTYEHKLFTYLSYLLTEMLQGVIYLGVI